MGSWIEARPWCSAGGGRQTAALVEELGRTGRAQAQVQVQVQAAGEERAGSCRTAGWWVEWCGAQAHARGRDSAAAAHGTDQTRRWKMGSSRALLEPRWIDELGGAVSRTLFNKDEESAERQNTVSGQAR